MVVALANATRDGIFDHSLAERLWGVNVDALASGPLQRHAPGARQVELQIDDVSRHEPVHGDNRVAGSHADPGKFGPDTLNPQPEISSRAHASTVHPFHASTVHPLVVSLSNHQRVRMPVGAAQ